MKSTLLYILLPFLLLMGACTSQKKIASVANKYLVEDSIFVQSHLGISIHDPETKKNIYGYQSSKLFTPASNTKILSCYAAMKYLPKFLPAAYLTNLDTAVLITPTGDPSFLQPDFNRHPLFDKLKSINKPLYIQQDNWTTPALGLGWSWDDYSEYYMTERSAFPVYGNQIHWYQEKGKKDNPTYPGDTVDLFIYSNPEVNWPVKFGTGVRNAFYVERARDENVFTLNEGKEKSAMESVPFITKGIQTGLTLLKDSLGKEIQPADENILLSAKKFKADTIYSQSTDTLLKIMMHRSDNFYADQCLAMVGQQRFQKMDEEGLIREMLSNELAGFPQKPTWVDGSGLSRYNLFSPDDMVYILDKIKTEQPWERIKTIFPKAGEGTLSMYKSSNDVYIYAKTGSMGGVLALSGYLYTQKKKWLIFSIMIDNTKAPNAKIRNQINEFLLKTAALY
jgi:D-alanyl-D-alanine carboxypeptidase/D-alanyl-D-alanine-endopeptidase (penicillin-binding protein 4)